MEFLFLIAIFVCLIFTIGVYIIIHYKNHKTPIFASIETLKFYLTQNYKKRNLNRFLVENSTLNIKSIKNNTKNNKNYINYKKLKKFKNDNLFKRIFKEKHKTYVEQKNYKLSYNLNLIAKKIKPLINKNSNKYRSINNECLIETVASSFAHSILLKENFNVFESFRDLTKVIRVYKKEAEILNVLIISKLITLYLNLQRDILKFKSIIKKGAKAKIKKITNTLSPAYIYGIYVFNPSSTKLLINKQELIISSTSFLLNELDSILIKQRIIFNYVKYFAKGL